MQTMLKRCYVYKRTLLKMKYKRSMIFLSRTKRYIGLVCLFGMMYILISGQTRQSTYDGNQMDSMRLQMKHRKLEDSGQEFINIPKRKKLDVREQEDKLEDDDQNVDSNPSKNRELLFTETIRNVREAVTKIQKSGIPQHDIEGMGFWGSFFVDCAKTYKKQAEMPRTVIHSTWAHLNNYDKNDVTLLAHSSADRYNMLDLMLHYWDGPVSAVIYVTPDHLAQVLYDFEKTAKKWITQRDDVDIQFVPKEGSLYPVNFMRNIALSSSHTNYVFNCDVDFIAKPSLHNDLVNLLQNTQLRNEVLVIPAFEFMDQDTHMFPDNKDSLIDLWDEQKVAQFHAYCPGCHGSTNYSKWRSAQKPYQIEWNFAYEPYIVGLKSELPEFSQKFLGRFFNKQSHILELHARGFTFQVLPDQYIIHMKHTETDFITRQKWRDWYKSCSHEAYAELKEELQDIAKQNNKILDPCVTKSGIQKLICLLKDH